ncbi:MAG TPA: S41 family peptidase [Candidatus Sulfotelmatobacter sp.]|nr:S41 family peptidase [Candidatus Sulfotelmatobacter sp.]
MKTTQNPQSTDAQQKSKWHSGVVPRRVSQILTMCLLLAGLRGAGAPLPDQAKPTVPVYTHAEMEADLEHLTVRLKRAWAYAEDKRTFLGVDLDALHAAAVRQLDEVQDADGFYLVVEKYIGGLMDGHASVRPGHSSSGVAATLRWPFKLMRLDGHFYVKAVEDAGTALQPGDEILSVNGVALGKQFESVLTRSTGSTPPGREHRALETMRRGADRQLRVEAARTNGPTFTCELSALARSGAHAATEEPIRWKTLEGNLGYLRLPSFAQDMKVWEEGGRGPAALQAALESKKSALRKAFAELADTRALILDLRGNGGGSDALGHFLAHHLCDTAAHPVYYSLATRISEDLVALPDFAHYKTAPASADNQRFPIKLLPEPGARRYQGKLAVLMDEACFSACDCFLNYLAIAAPKTVFVGRPNGAGAGAPRPVVTLPHSKIVITCCVMQVWNLTDQLIESRPLKPTVPVKWTPDDLRQSRDPDLAAALRHLAR